MAVPKTVLYICKSLAHMCHCIETWWGGERKKNYYLCVNVMFQSLSFLELVSSES